MNMHTHHIIIIVTGSNNNNNIVIFININWILLKKKSDMYSCISTSIVIIITISKITFIIHMIKILSNIVVIQYHPHMYPSKTLIRFVHLNFCFPLKGFIMTKIKSIRNFCFVIHHHHNNHYLMLINYLYDFLPYIDIKNHSLQS